MQQEQEQYEGGGTLDSDDELLPDGDIDPTRPENVRLAFYFWHLKAETLLHDRPLTMRDLVDAVTALSALEFCEWHRDTIDERRASGGRMPYGSSPTCMGRRKLVGR